MSNNKVNYVDYEKITDDICFLGGNISMKMNVILSRKNTRPGHEGERYFFHHEYRYPSNKYTDTNVGISIKRTFSYYITIEDSNDWKNTVMIRLKDIMLLRNAVNEASKWASDGTFVIRGKQKQLQIVRKVNTIKVENLGDGKFIWFDPVIITKDGILYPGIRLTLANSYTDIEIDQFFGFVYAINTIDMFGSAQVMLNYLQRPQLGYGLVDMEREGFGAPYTEPTQSITKYQPRELPNSKKNKSKFDNLMD